jgi:biopolymer transport protein ExbD
MAFGKFSDDGQAQPTAEINMIPMIDVMLVLLIVFILAAPLLVHAVKVDLPRETSQADHLHPADISLGIDKDGQIWWGMAPVTAADLDQRLEEEGRKAETPELHIRADRNVSYGHVADLMALASRKGLHKIAFVSDPVAHQ